MRARHLLAAATLAACPLLSSADPFEDVRDVAVRVSDRKAVTRESRRVLELLGWYGRLARGPAMDADELSRRLVSVLRSGEADSLLLGESHGNSAERDAAETIIESVMAAGVPVGMFLQEATEVVSHQTGLRLPDVGLFKRTERLERAGVPILLMRAHFTPEGDVRAALAAARPGILITYTGSVHTAPRVRDYIIGKLELPDLDWGRMVPDRPVVEQAVKAARRRAVVVAMWEEDRTFEAILSRCLAEASRGATAADWPGRLSALQTAWAHATAAFPSDPRLRFVQDPERSNLYLGLLAADRGPRAVAAAATVAADPDFARWLGSRKVKAVSASRVELAERLDRGRWGYRISVDKGGAETFVRDVPLR